MVYILVNKKTKKVEFVNNSLSDLMKYLPISVDINDYQMFQSVELEDEYYQDLYDDISAKHNQWLNSI